MSTRLKIFVSSTMRDDLENERDMVCTRLRELNFEPVNAESWSPNGNKTWPRIQEEMRDSHVFLLFLGKRYGWIPESGPGAAEKRSVTHMEYLEARALDLPILPFFKSLDYDTTDRTGPESLARDAFRKEVASWSDGKFIGEFHLASDVCVSVVKSLILMLSDDWVRSRIEARARTASPPLPPATVAPPRRPVLPPALIEAVRRHDAVLFAGAGMSLAAGLPSAVAFAERLSYEIQIDEPGYGISPSAAVFAGTAADLILLKGLDAVIAGLNDLMQPPQGLEPTSAHRAAVRLFDTIVTTNYDGLFEISASASRPKMTVFDGELTASTIMEPALVKLHGSWAKPPSLVITERDVLTLDQTHPRLWNALRELLCNRVVITVGMSLRDPSIVRLFSEAGSKMRGFAVMPGQFRLRDARLGTMNLQAVNASADPFFEELERRVGATAAPGG